MGLVVCTMVAPCVRLEPTSLHDTVPDGFDRRPAPSADDADLPGRCHLTWRQEHLRGGGGTWWRVRSPCRRSRRSPPPRRTRRAWWQHWWVPSSIRHGLGPFHSHPRSRPPPSGIADTALRRTAWLPVGHSHGVPRRNCRRRVDRRHLDLAADGTPGRRRHLRRAGSTVPCPGPRSGTGTGPDPTRRRTAPRGRCRWYRRGGPSGVISAMEKLADQRSPAARRRPLIGSSPGRRGGRPCPPTCRGRLRAQSAHGRGAAVAPPRATSLCARDRSVVCTERLLAPAGGPRTITRHGPRTRRNPSPGLGFR